MFVIFDLDGVVIDSANVIRECYRQAGVEAPADILAQEGTNWLASACDDPWRTHRRKNHHYLEALRSGRVATLPALEVARALSISGNEAAIMSSAPLGAVAALREGIERSRPGAWWPFKWWVEETRTPEKMSLLGRLSPKGVYVDDQDRLVTVPSEWRFVHYHGQSRSELTREVMACISV